MFVELTGKLNEMTEQLTGGAPHHTLTTPSLESLGDSQLYDTQYILVHFFLLIGDPVWRLLGVPPEAQQTKFWRPPLHS